MNENKVNNNEPLDIKFKDKKKDKNITKPKDGSFDLLSSDGDSLLHNPTFDSDVEKDDIELNADEFEIALDSNDVDVEIENSVVTEVNNDADDVPPKQDSKDLNSIFEIVNNNVKEATNLFNKNIEMKKKIEEQLRKLQKDKEEHEAKKNEDYKKIKSYKQEVYDKLKTKKNEIENELASLKETQVKIINEKNKFEKYKRDELIKLKQVEAKNQAALAEEKNAFEEEKKAFEKEKEALEETKRSLELDKIKYETDKNELANNLMKFNELVGDFTVGIDRFNLGE